MCVFSKIFCLERFIQKFYSFQEEMGITDRMCLQNSYYLKQELKQYDINVVVKHGGILYVAEEMLKEMKHTWVEYEGVVIEPNRDLFYNDIVIGYFELKDFQKKYKVIEKSFSNGYKISKKIKKEDKILYEEHCDKYNRVGNDIWSNAYISMLHLRYIPETIDEEFLDTIEEQKELLDNY